MTLAPEVVLANELEIAVAGMVIGHKYSIAGRKDPLDKVGWQLPLLRSEVPWLDHARDAGHRCREFRIKQGCYNQTGLGVSFQRPPG